MFSLKIKKHTSKSVFDRQMILIKCEALFSLKNKKKIFQSLICCSRD